MEPARFIEKGNGKRVFWRRVFLHSRSRREGRGGWERSNTGVVIYHAPKNMVDKEIGMEASAEEYTPLLQLETTYIANSYGISKLDEGNGTWIKVMDGTDTTLNNPAFSPRWLYKNKAGNYFVFFVSSHGSKLVEYSQSTEVSQLDTSVKDAGEAKIGSFGYLDHLCTGGQQNHTERNQ